jgi:hypothetical protein
MIGSCSNESEIPDKHRQPHVPFTDKDSDKRPTELSLFYMVVGERQAI